VLVQRCGRLWADLVWAGSEKFPEVASRDTLEVPLADGDASTHRALTAGHGETAALAERGGFQTEPETAEIVPPVHALRPVPHSLVEDRRSHTSSVVSDPDPGVETIEPEVDIDILGTGGDAVIDEVGDRGGQVVPDVAKGVDETACGGEEDDRCWHLFRS
jgi:hypothetical protein